jgi:sugar-specific transcriptional regulator TrmB
LRLAPVVPYGKDRSLTQSGDSDLIDRLVRHGLGQGEARCYVGMLGQRAFKVSEVAIEAGLPRSRAYELIRSLVRFGLCTEVAGGGYARFRAVPPNEAIGRLEASRAEQSRRRDLALTGLQQALAERSRPSPESGQEPVEMLRRREQLLTEMAKEVCQATEEVLTIVNTSWDPADCRGMRDRLRAGVRFRTIFDRSSLDHEPHREWVASLAGEPGFEVRVVDRVETLYLLVDRSVIFLNLVVQRLRHQSALEQADRVQDTAMLVADLFAHYYEAPQGDDPFEYVELIKNSDAAWARRDAITAGAEKEVVQARRMTGPGTRPRAGDEVGVREGVSYRALYEIGFLAFPEFTVRLAERERRGEQIRFIDRVPVGMTAVDRRKCLLALNPTGLTSGQGSWVVLEQPALAHLLTDAFDLLWDQAEPAPR